MESTEQMSGLTVRQHGEDVWNTTRKLVLSDFKDLMIPDWFIKKHDYIINNIHDFDIIKRYTIFHDCGKPYCLEIDKDGKRHFPNHAEISFNKFLDCFPDREIEAKLILNDMIFHTLKYDEIVKLNLTKKDLSTLFLVALAEINSNAKMFGGYESESFKIKFKKLSKLGKKLFDNLVKYRYSYLIVRNDISDVQKLIQSSHASFEAGKEFNHESLVAVIARSENKLKIIMSKLLELNIKFKIFRDNIFNDEITCICTEPIENCDYLKKFNLLKF